MDRAGQGHRAWRRLALVCVRWRTRDKAPPMVTVYVGSFPPDPEADLNNFQRKQAEYAAAWRCNRRPARAVRGAPECRRIPAIPPRGFGLADDRHGRLRHEEQNEGRKEGQNEPDGRTVSGSYAPCPALSVRSGQKGHTKERALDLAVAVLEATGEAAARRTPPLMIRPSEVWVTRDGHPRRVASGNEMEILALVLRSL